MDKFPPSLQRPALLEFAHALDSRPSALRRDENGDWRINGRGGHIYAVPEGFQIFVLNEKLEAGLAGRWTSRGWTSAKSALDFARLVNDGDDEGAFILDRLPSPSEAAILRRYCMVPKRVSLGEEELARRRELAAVNLGGYRAKNPQVEDFRVKQPLDLVGP
jgi:hypothetical protein